MKEIAKTYLKDGPRMPQCVILIKGRISKMTDLAKGIVTQVHTYICTYLNSSTNTSKIIRKIWNCYLFHTFSFQILGYSDDLLDLSDLRAEENLAKLQANLTDKHAGVIKLAVENLRKQSLEFKMGFDAKEKDYEMETELFKNQYNVASEKEKQLAFEKINNKYSEYKVSVELQGDSIEKKINVMGCNFLSKHISPQVGKAKMCLRGGIFSKKL